MLELLNIQNLLKNVVQLFFAHYNIRILLIRTTHSTPKNYVVIGRLRVFTSAAYSAMHPRHLWWSGRILSSTRLKQSLCSDLQFRAVIGFASQCCNERLLENHDRRNRRPERLLRPVPISKKLQNRIQWLWWRLRRQWFGFRHAGMPKN